MTATRIVLKAHLWAERHEVTTDRDGEILNVVKTRLPESHHISSTDAASFFAQASQLARKHEAFSLPAQS